MSFQALNEKMLQTNGLSNVYIEIDRFGTMGYEMGDARI
jgi:hypothetical protein